ncbi:hypothetical protein J6590_047062 [Homalodisca vitripennis]|nr:hypothetical protein J6590_047062 [Homalodisca vitripennis]
MSLNKAYLKVLAWRSLVLQEYPSPLMAADLDKISPPILLPQGSLIDLSQRPIVSDSKQFTAVPDPPMLCNLASLAFFRRNRLQCLFGTLNVLSN